MKRTTFQNLLTIAVVAASVATHAQERSLSIITDQDFFYTVDKTRNEDRNYTQGSSITVADPHFIGSWIFWPHRILNGLNNSLANQREELMSAVTIVGTAFTPRIIDSINPIVGDRPFAFLLALSTTQVNRIGFPKLKGGRYEAFTLNYGLLGTTLGYSFQGWAHANLVKGRPTDPKGWNTQIGKGVKPTFLFNYEKIVTTLLVRSDTARPSALGIDGFWSFGGSFGYYERVFSGLGVRIGKINPSNVSSWAFWGSSIGSANRNVVPGIVPVQNSSFELFGFSRATVNLMARNALLRGLRFGRSAGEYTLDPSWINVAVLDWEFGMAFGWYWNKQLVSGETRERFFRILYKNTVRSPEFNSRIFAPRWHYFGSAGIQFTIN